MDQQQNENSHASAQSRAEGANLTDVLEDWRLDEFGQPMNPNGWGIALLTPHGGYMTLPPLMAEKIVAALSSNN